MILGAGMRMKWIGLMGLFVLVLILAACGAEPETAVPEGTEPAVAPPQPTGGQSSESGATPVSPLPTPVVESEPGQAVVYEQVALGDADLSLEVPGSWERLEPEWAWSPEGTSEVRVGVQWADLTPPVEAEAALLPKNAQVLDAQELELGWGAVRQFDVEVYAEPVPEPGDGTRTVGAVERHVLVVVTLDGARRAYDFYATAPTQEALAPLLAVLDQMVASAEMGAAAGEGASMPALESPLATPQMPPQPQTETVQVFFSNLALDPTGTDCAAVFAVEREIPAAAERLDAALNELFAGPAADEQAEGYSSWFSLDTANILLDAFVERDTAYVNLADVRQLIPNAGTSCGSAQFLAQVGQTAQVAVPGITRVLYAIEGDPAPFYEWLQIGCSAANDFCDPGPFEGQ